MEHEARITEVLKGIEVQLRRIADGLASSDGPRAADLSDEQFVDLAGLEQHSGLSRRTLQRAIADPDHPLPSIVSPTGGKRLVRWGDFKGWLCDGAADEPDHERRLRAVIDDLERKAG